MWSWILAAVGVTGIYFVGRKTIWGWLVLLLNECLWTIYAVQTKQYGFILASISYAVVYIRSFLHWRNDSGFEDSSQLNVLCYNCGGMYKVGYDAVRECPKCVDDKAWDNKAVDLDKLQKWGKSFDWHRENKVQ